MKKSYFMLLSALALSSSIYAEDLANNMHHLDDSKLSQVFGQAFNLNVALPHLNHFQRQLIQETIQRLTQIEVQQGSADNLKEIFQTLPNGQIKMQIDRDVISIGVIEFRLKFDGLSEIGESMIDQISF